MASHRAHVLRGTLLAGAIICGCRSLPPVPPLAPPFQALIPRPASVVPVPGRFELAAGAVVYAEPATEVLKVAQLLADRLKVATGYDLQVLPDSGTPPRGSLRLTTAGADPALGDEGYVLTVSSEQVAVVAAAPAGLFYGVQTLRELFPPAIESHSSQPGPWTLAAVTITDKPRFPWRGAMLDVARHFFSVADVKRFVDLLAGYKMNRLHLHLSDDQGWRIAIDAWPDLAPVGGRSQVGGSGEPLYYTQADYAEIVRYAAGRYVTVVPEIDMPGHTNAALAAYPELSCDGAARQPYTGIAVGFSSLCTDREPTLRFVRDVVREIAALTPGPYVHIGGDEARSTQPADYIRFMEEAQRIVSAEGKHAIGWEEFANVQLLSGSLVQQWDQGLAQKAVRQGARLILSPSKRIYLDMKYTAASPLGQDWAGRVEVETAYNWDPASYLPGVSERDIVGVEAPLWTETIKTLADVEFMTLPRLAGVAEIGWSPQAARRWKEYRVRLAAQERRWNAMGVHFYRSPQVPWP
jgi:hexosaminidase